MKQLLKIEFRRAIVNPFMGISILIGLGIAISHVVLNIMPLYDSIYTYEYPITVFEKWMGGENSTIQPVLIYLLTLILTALPYVGTIKQDMKSGYVKNVFTRSNKKKYFLVKYIVTFLTSGILSILPFVVNFMLTAMILPATIPQASTAFYPIFAYNLFGGLFYSHPYVYLGIYLLIDLVFFGLLTTVGLMAAFWSENIFVVMLSPFIFYLFIYSVTQLTGMIQYCPFGFLRPSQPVCTTFLILAEEIVVLLLIGGTYLYVGFKKEVL